MAGVARTQLEQKEFSWLGLPGKDGMGRAPCGDLCHGFVTKAKGVQLHPAERSGCEHPWRMSPLLWKRMPPLLPVHGPKLLEFPVPGSLLPCPLHCPSLAGDKKTWPGEQNFTPPRKEQQQRTGNQIRAWKNFPTSLSLSPWAEGTAPGTMAALR